MEPMTTHDIPSDRNPAVTYKVAEFADGRFTCQCGDYENRHKDKGTHCKHIRRVVAGRRVGVIGAVLEDLFPPEDVDTRIREAVAANAPVAAGQGFPSVPWFRRPAD